MFKVLTSHIRFVQRKLSTSIPRGVSLTLFSGRQRPMLSRLNQDSLCIFGGSPFALRLTMTRMSAHKSEMDVERQPEKERLSLPVSHPHEIDILRVPCAPRRPTLIPRKSACSSNSSPPSYLRNNRCTFPAAGI